jgi:hypothetical protein
VISNILNNLKHHNMKTNHTPAPWVLKSNNLKDLHIRKGDKGNVIAEVCQSGLMADQPEALANAQLIAAAPELLEQLSKLVIFIQNIDTDLLGQDFEGFDLKAAEEVIEKATK